MLTFTGAICAVFVVSFLGVTLFGRKRKASEPPLIPSWIPFIGSGLEFQRNQLGFLRKNEEKYGPIFTAYMGGSYFHFVLDPWTFPTVAKEGRKLSFRELTAASVKRIFDITRRDRNTPAAHGLFPKYLQGASLDHLVRETMKNLQDSISERGLMDGAWREQGLLQFVTSLMFHAQLTTLCGDFPKSGREATTFALKEQLVKDFKSFDDNFHLLAQGYPISACKGAKEARQRWWDFFSEDQRSQRTDEYALLTENARLREDEQGSDAVPKDMFGLLWAAAANTNPAAFWTVYLMLKHPDAWDAANAEVERMLRKTGQHRNQRELIDFSRQELEEMTVLNSIALEAMRVSSSPSSPRQATEDFDLTIACSSETYRLRKGDKVMVAFQTLHTDAEIYPEPFKFKYDRFLNEDGTEKTDFYKGGNKLRNYLQPFGMGVSKCPGRMWAMTELKQAVIIFVTLFEIQLIDPTQDVAPLNDRFMVGMLMPSRDPRVRFRRRSSST